MVEEVSAHYGSGSDLAEKIAEGLRNAGKDLNELKAIDLSAVDEFHFRGRNATLQLAEEMKLSEDAKYWTSAAAWEDRRERSPRNMVAM